MAEDEKLVEETSAAESAAVSSEEASAEPKRRKSNKGKIIGVVIAAIVALGGGFMAWHDTPGFCNSVCHDPMDSYVESVVTGTKAMTGADHMKVNIRCLACHEAKLTEQVSEVMSWVSNDFTTDANDKLVPAVDFASQEFCARSGCHDMGEVIEKTWGFEGNDEKYNPHSSHQDLALSCGDCHKAHEQSTLVCNDCHALKAPEGWEA